jgi:hypothetical protein
MAATLHVNDWPQLSYYTTLGAKGRWREKGGGFVDCASLTRPQPVHSKVNYVLQNFTHLFLREPHGMRGEKGFQTDFHLIRCRQNLFKRIVHCAFVSIPIPIFKNVLNISKQLPQRFNEIHGFLRSSLRMSSHSWQ